MLAEHGHAARHLHDVDDAGHGFRLGRVERFDLGAEHRRARDQRDQHVRPLDVDAELRRTADLGLAVQAFGRFADEGEILRLLELDLVRNRQLRRGIGEFTVAGLVFGADDESFFRAAVDRLHIPFLRGRGDQQCARRRAGLAQLTERFPGAGRATGHLHAECGVRVGRRRRRVFDVNLVPVAIEFVGNDHRQRGPDALPHLRMLEQDRDDIVRCDAHERVRRRHRRRDGCG